MQNGKKLELKDECVCGLMVNMVERKGEGKESRRWIDALLFSVDNSCVFAMAVSN
jgi:hypothetical protein